MNIVERDFYQDVKNKRRLAASSRHKKNGSRSKKCKLPSDNLTKKQIRERSGDTIVYNLTKPMKWSEFKSLPDHAQKEYLSYLNESFGATATDMAKMFGVISSTVLRYIDSKNIGVQFKRGQRMSGVQKEAWSKFLMSDSIQEQRDEAPCESREESSTEETSSNLVLKPCDVKNPETNLMKMSEITLRFDGMIDVNSIANTLKIVLGNKSNGCLLISYTRTEPNESEESAI